jgi:hypothetical protein
MAYDKSRMIEFHVIDIAEVDGTEWYSIIAGRESAKWLREQPTSDCIPHSKVTINLFNISKDLLIIMKLRWL